MESGSRLRFWGPWIVILGLGYLWFEHSQPAAPVAPTELSRTPGVRLFYRYECGRCHTVTALPGVRGKMGPPLDHVGRVAATRRAGMTARDYLRQSLVDPQAYVVEGYLRTMPKFALNDAELDELVNYLLTLK